MDRVLPEKGNRTINVSLSSSQHQFPLNKMDKVSTLQGPCPSNWDIGCSGKLYASSNFDEYLGPKNCNPIPILTINSRFFKDHNFRIVTCSISKPNHRLSKNISSFIWNQFEPRCLNLVCFLILKMWFTYTYVICMHCVCICMHILFCVPTCTMYVCRHLYIST